MRHRRVNEVANRAFDSFLPRSFSLFARSFSFFARSFSFISHVFCLLFLAFLHAFARSFGKRLLLNKAGNLHHTPLFSFLSPLVFRVSNAVKKYILSHLLYFGFIDSFVRVSAESATIRHFRRNIFPKITQTSLFL